MVIEIDNLELRLLHVFTIFLHPCRTIGKQVPANHEVWGVSDIHVDLYRRCCTPQTLSTKKLETWTFDQRGIHTWSSRVTVTMKNFYQLLDKIRCQSHHIYIRSRIIVNRHGSCGWGSPMVELMPVLIWLSTCLQGTWCQPNTGGRCADTSGLRSDSWKEDYEYIYIDQYCGGGWSKRRSLRKLVMFSHILCAAKVWWEILTQQGFK